MLLSIRIFSYVDDLGEKFTRQNGRESHPVIHRKGTVLKIKEGNTISKELPFAASEGMLASQGRLSAACSLKIGLFCGNE